MCTNTKTGDDVADVQAELNTVLEYFDKATERACTTTNDILYSHIVRIFLRLHLRFFVCAHV